MLLPVLNTGHFPCTLCNNVAKYRGGMFRFNLQIIDKKTEMIYTDCTGIFRTKRKASSCKEEWTSACLSSYSRGDRQLVELCLESAGFSRRCTRVSVPLRVVPSSTGLPLKRCPGIGFLSRADRGIGVFQHVLPPMKLRLKYSR